MEFRPRGKGDSPEGGSPKGGSPEGDSPSRFGTHRVLMPAGGLPQMAEKLDNSLPPFDNEILVQLKSLQLDSASFYQLKKEKEGPENSSLGTVSLSEKILRIIRERGKMHNPVTNSGGVFLGKVSAIGPKHPLKENLKINDNVVSLVSLTLTPLLVNSIHAVDEKTGQVFLDGFAIIFESGLASKIPADFSESIALAVLDVCGAPAQVKRLIREKQKILILGLGKAGKLAALQASLMGGEVYGVDSNPADVQWCRENLKGHFETLSAQNTLQVYGWVDELTKGALVDLVVHAVPLPDAEMSSILPCRPGGSVLFFGMSCSFQKAVLGAEGVGKDVTLLMGNGYVPGHAELALNLLREHQGLRKWFEEKYG